ncbi:MULTISPECIES: LuxR C-terminal-related transcriptional regulator [Rhodanobacter]|uniref:LuxR C-terminal-related transcriptional regulator n=1 Tax=Rhodanobacter TaxID=75309 RepID=UPI00055C2786|nr:MULTISPECIES: LuxR C-terminal-related transcriptional regulator [Rhodanobacter]TAN17495.1 MAG: LuxR family transcriptional regulator [Rhodanobacter sp.]UJJ56442.1 LuxR C-terminal-related transcriptional regulator [Rhodanobacter thiooxydans]
MPSEPAKVPASSILLVGKLEPPSQRVALATRSALSARLKSWREHALTLLVSPPGFGKTTLLAQWWLELQSESDVTAAWLTLDEDDAEPARLISNIILSLHRAGLDVGALETIAENGLLESSTKATLLSLLSRIAANRGAVVLILDDYQLAQCPSAAEIVEILLRRGGRNLHLAISSRDRPSIHLSALIARGLVQTIGAADLMFTLQESATLFDGMLEPEEHALLYARSEGWAVVSQLARIWMRRGREHALPEFAERSGEIADYLSEQVLRDLPHDLQEFLMDAAVFDRFNAPMLDSVRERYDGAELLERLTHLDALLIPLDRGRDWFRFHSLFGDFLRDRLALAHPERTAVLQMRASVWLHRHGDLLEAVRQALRAAETARAIAFVEDARSWQLILTHGLGFVSNLLKLFPRETLESDPLLLVLQAYLDIKRGEWSNARRCLESIGPRLATLNTEQRNSYTIVHALWVGYLDESGKPERHAEIDRFIASLAEDDYVTRATAQAISTVDSLALAEFDRAERYSRDGIANMQAGNCVVGTTYCLFHLGESLYYRGEWDTAEDIYHRALELAEANFGTDSMLKAAAGSLLAPLLYHRNRLDEAAALIDSSLATIERQDGWFDIYALAYETATRLAFARNGGEAGRAMLQRVRANARVRGFRELERLANAWQLELDTGKASPAAALGQAAAALEEPRLRADASQCWRERYAWTVTAVKLALTCSQYARALQWADREIAVCVTQGRRAAAANLGMLAALARKGQGDVADAIGRFSAALDFACGTDAVGLFFNLPPSAEALIREALNDGRALPPLGAARAFLLRVQRELRTQHADDASVLSGRELDVLRELHHGRSNKAIGCLLGLSENTVKFHLKQIYRKLGVDSRTAALSAAHRLALPLDALD